MPLFMVEIWSDIQTDNRCLSCFSTGCVLLTRLDFDPYSASWQDSLTLFSPFFPLPLWLSPVCRLTVSFSLSFRLILSLSPLLTCPQGRLNALHLSILYTLLILNTLRCWCGCCRITQPRKPSHNALKSVKRWVKVGWLVVAVVHPS